MSIEKAPKLSTEELVNALIRLPKLPIAVQSLVEQINEKYEYWDTVKYKPLPKGFSATDLWQAVVAYRQRNTILAWDKYAIHFCLTNKMQQQCHEFDMNFGGSWESDAVIPNNHRERYLISSLMEEAISSSLMEGAATTRKVAKEMLRKKITPKDKSQQMIFNNYQTIRFITENKHRPLTEELLLHIHRLMTENTLSNAEDAGRFRQTDDVVVENGITHEVVHTPPAAKELPVFVSDLCSFFNAKQTQPFIHPIIKGIVIHFMVAYMHPFADGNGRTARALFYWYMLRQGYWLTEYMSISRIIYKKKTAYERAFLYSEADSNDIGYFVAYNLRVLEEAFSELQTYIRHKTQERQAAAAFLHIGNINERQAEIMKMYYDNPKLMLTVRDVQERFLITPTTAKSDITGLLNIGALQEIALNKVKKGYIKGEDFDELTNNKTI
ncbi:MAG: Fic family protein [Paludibacteraceae bacterium]